jgi:hypothetical protein
MRQLIALIFLAVPLCAQTGDVALDALTARKSLYATQLNGSTQYWSRATPTGMDLNGAETITNTGFEVNTTGWAQVGAGTKSIARVTTQAHTGSASLQILFNSPPSLFTGVTASDTLKLTGTQKVTGECWVKTAATDSTSSVQIRIVAPDGSTSIALGGNVAITRDTWTKVVFNGTLTGAQGAGVRFRIAKQNAGVTDTMWVDDVSLTQAYDAVVMAVVRPSLASGTSKMMVDQSSAGGGDPRCIFYLNATTELLSALVSDGVTTITNVAGGSSLVDGSWHGVALTLDRTGNLVKYVDATATGNSSIAAVGKVTFTTVNVGVNGAGAAFFPGSIGPVQVIRFDALPSDIASVIAYVNATWRRRGFPKAYTGGTVVLNVDWKTGGLDKSNSGNHLTGTASPTRTKVR